LSEVSDTIASTPWSCSIILSARLLLASHGSGLVATPLPCNKRCSRGFRATNGICSKRLVPYLPELVAVLVRVGELRLEAETKTRLLALSPATADRLLQAERQRSKPHGLSTTKPGTLTKDAIPIRTFADWDDVQPGFSEVDLVVHCGQSTKGEYLHSLTLTDVATGWTECVAPRNRGQQVVWAGIVRARARLPFPRRGIDSDNGVEFINKHLLRYCQQEQLTFTRSRPYKKNDQAYVEQKNWSIVRQLVGNGSYDGQQACDRLQRLYDVVRLYTNFFQPSMKLVSKERSGGKVKKTYDQAKTPYQRVLASQQVESCVKEALQQEHLTLNPVALLRQIRRSQAAFWELAVGNLGSEGAITSQSSMHGVR
jgi:hypothetical protein